MTHRGYGNNDIPVAPSDVPDCSHVDVHVDGRLELCRAIEAFADKHWAMWQRTYDRIASRRAVSLASDGVTCHSA
jgi:hypothetical protein